MRTIALTAVSAALLAAAPALALTVSPAPNRDQASHLRTEKGPAGNTDLRDTLAGGGRPNAGLDFLGGDRTYTRSQTFGFGNVTTTITTGRGDYRPSLFDTDPRFGGRSRFDAYAPIGRRR